MFGYLHVILVVLSIILWIYPLFVFLKYRFRNVFIHFIVQAIYSAFWLYMINYNGAKGQAFVWLFWWFYMIVIQMLLLNIYLIRRRKRGFE